MLKNLSVRSEDNEIMDDFNNPPVQLREILEDINRVNYLLGGFKITVNAIAKLLRQNLREAYTIVDFGCADGSMLRVLAAFCRKKHLNVRFIGIDLNENALQLAKDKSIDFPEIEYFKKDILKVDFQKSGCDIIISTLTLHHFKDSEVKNLMKYFIKTAAIGVVINDLQRTKWAYYLFKVFSLIFIKTPIARIDGLISIRRAFNREELRKFASSMPEAVHQIKWKWAFRYLWIAQKKQP